ncbi:MAG: methylmalonyl Co-A mutase-associated GTPase MeaB [Verrucomicrobiota bacterium]
MRNLPDIDQLVEGVLAGDRAVLAKAITLVESRATRHVPLARELIRRILPHSGGALRIGLTGTPGAGKSTFIEAMGLYLCGLGKKIAVLAVDPSSSITGGSILGDKTRMEELCREENVFIRPSPSGDSLGGVAARTREALLVCEAAGYGVILVETVGVGQSETAVRTMTDFFLLLQISGGGDELQGIKKGVIELADAIVVNKADGENRVRARQACVQFTRVMQVLQPFTSGWTPKALTCSALEREGIEEIWNLILRFRDQLNESGVFEQRRRAQSIDWFRSLLHQSVINRFIAENKERIQNMETAIERIELPVSSALDELLK